MQRIINFIYRPKLMRILILMLTDAIASICIFLMVASAYKYFGGIYDLSIYVKLLPFFILFIIGNIVGKNYHGSILYPGVCINKIDEVRCISLSVIISYCFIFAWLLFVQRNVVYSRFVLFSSMILTIPILPIIRFLVRYIMHRFKLFQINCFIAGAGATGRLIADELSNSCYYGFNVIGFLDDDKSKGVLGTLAEARKLSRRHKVSYCICCLPLHMVNKTFRIYSKIFPHLMFIPHNRLLPTSWLRVAHIGLFSGFELRNELLLSGPRLTKSIVEVLIAFVTIVCLTPLFIFLSILIKITNPGPIFYLANRIGKNGKKIKVLKFRTMYNNAEQQLEKVLSENPTMQKEWQEKFKLSQDPRITPVGKFLRKTSLDELPQFWNVLKGDMAIIGPRPIVEEEVKYYKDNYELLKRVKPGITGLWQVSGRSDIDYINRVTLDSYYIINWSVWLDYYIFLKTIFVVLTAKGSY